MDYNRIYTGLIIKARFTNNLPEEYYEEHHIIPRYMNGENSEDNLVLLTYKQHILAHKLLYLIYNNPEDKCAYTLMEGLGKDRKVIIGKMIGEKHLKSGHIQKLGQLNKESGWIVSIRTFESMSKGGKRGGGKMRDTGKIHLIRSAESSFKGGIVAGNIAKESGQIQSLAKYSGKYILIMPDGREFLHCFQASEATGLSRATINSRCKAGWKGFSRRPKSEEELKTRWINR